MFDVEAQSYRGDWFGYGGSKIGPPDTYGQAARIYGPALASVGSYYARKHARSATDAAVAFGSYVYGKRRRVEPEHKTDLSRLYGKTWEARVDSHLYKMPRKRYTKRRRVGKRRFARRLVRKFKSKYKKRKSTSIYKGLLQNLSNKACFRYNYRFTFYGSVNAVSIFHPGQDQQNNQGWISPANSGLTFAAAPATAQGTIQGALDSPGILTCMREAGMIDSGNKKYMITSRKLQMIITNFQTHEIDLRVYWCKFRKVLPDQFSTVGFPATKGIIEPCDINSFLGYCMWTDGLISVGPNTMSLLDESETLFKSRSFCQWAKVLKVEKYTIQSGKCITAGVTKKKPWIIDDRYIQNANNGTLGFTETIFPIVQAWGCPGFDPADTRKIGRTRPILGVMLEQVYNMYNLNTTTPSMYSTNLANPNGLPGSYSTQQKPTVAIVAEL